jgi:hypothetical protein
MGNIVPSSAMQILEKTLDSVRLRANSNGECFGGEIMDAMREAGLEQGVDRLEVLLTRTAGADDGIARGKLSRYGAARLRK